MPTPTEDLKAPFTDEQLRWLSAREHTLSVKGTEWSRKHLKSYTRRAVVGFLILLMGVAGAFYQTDQDRQERSKNAQEQRKAIVQSGRVVSVDGCNRDYLSREGLRGLLFQAQLLSNQQFRQGKIPADQHQLAKDFYDKELEALPSLDCRPAASLITDNPNAKLPAVPAPLPAVPAPLHPPDKPFAGPH